MTAKGKQRALCEKIHRNITYTTKFGRGSNTVALQVPTFSPHLNSEQELSTRWRSRQSIFQNRVQNHGQYGL